MYFPLQIDIWRWQMLLNLAEHEMTVNEYVDNLIWFCRGHAAQGEAGNDAETRPCRFPCRSRLTLNDK